jgi:agmatine deiminase
MSRRDYERQLSEWMGIEKVIWLPFGLVEDSGRLSTGGHVDDVAQFLGPELVLAQSCRPGNPNYSRLQENLEVLRAATDAQGRALEVVEIELLPYVTDVGRGLMHVLGPGAVRSMPAPYVNLVFVNGGVLVPQVGANGEEDVYALLARLLPGREVVPARVELQAFGGGGLGCITQQVPAGDVLPAS